MVSSNLHDQTRRELCLPDEIGVTAVMHVPGVQARNLRSASTKVV